MESVLLLCISRYWPQHGLQRSAACYSGHIWDTVCASLFPETTPFQLQMKDKRQSENKRKHSQHAELLLWTNVLFSSISCARLCQSVTVYKSDVPHCITLHNNDQLVQHCFWTQWRSCHHSSRVFFCGWRHRQCPFTPQDVEMTG